MSRGGAFFVTYKRPEELAKSIESLFKQTRKIDLLVIVDNSPSAETESVISAFQENITYLPMKDNTGSAGGIAVGIQWLYDRGCEWIYCGDDDNPPRSPETIERLIRLLEQGNDIAAAGAVGAKWDWRRGRLDRIPDHLLSGILEVDVIGGSGQMIVRRETIERVGLPAKELFFGYPDVEYCLRIRKAGFKILIDGDLMMSYRVAANRLNIAQQRLLIPRRRYESIWRNYYTSRNYIYMMKNTFHRPDLAGREIFRALVRSVFSWFRGVRYGAAFTTLQSRAVFDGIFGRLGRRIPPGAK